MIRSVMAYQRHTIGKTTDEIVRTLLGLHVNRVELKVTDGNWRMTTPSWSAYQGDPNTTRELVRSLQRAGIEVYGWGFVYGRDPAGELDRVLEAFQDLPLTGWIHDAEEELLRRKNGPQIISNLCAGIHQQHPKIPQTWCSMAIQRNPNRPAGQENNPGWDYFNREVYQAALPYCRYGMPMAYWPANGLANIKAWLGLAIAQWSELGWKEIIPVLRGYSTGIAARPNPKEISAIGTYCYNATGVIGTSWFTLDSMLAVPALYRALSEWYSDLMDVDLAGAADSLHRAVEA